MEDNIHAEDPKTASHAYLHFDPANMSGIFEPEVFDGPKEGDVEDTSNSVSDDSAVEARVASLEAELQAMKLAIESRFAAIESLMEGLPSRIAVVLGPLSPTASEARMDNFA